MEALDCQGRKTEADLKMKKNVKRKNSVPPGVLDKYEEGH